MIYLIRNERSLSEAEQRYFKKRNLIEFLKRDNQDMEVSLRILSEQNKKYRVELEHQESEIADCEDILKNLQRDIKKKDEQIQMLRREDQDPQARETEKRVRMDLEYVSANSEKSRMINVPSRPISVADRNRSLL